MPLSQAIEGFNISRLADGYAPFPGWCINRRSAHWPSIWGTLRYNLLRLKTQKPSCFTSTHRTNLKDHQETLTRSRQLPITGTGNFLL